MRKESKIWYLALEVAVNNAFLVGALICANLTTNSGLKLCVGLGVWLFGLCWSCHVAWRALTHTTTDMLVFFGILGAFEMAFFSLQVGYTAIFEVIGIRGAENTVTHHLLDALYFSIVTWTTTGYGDYSPIGPGRWLACSEALVGTAFNGLALASIIYHMNLRAKQGRE
jgi:hypothetical protein